MSPDPLRPSQKAALEASMNSLYLKATKSVMYWRSEADRLDRRATRWQVAFFVMLILNGFLFFSGYYRPGEHSNRWSVGPFKAIAGRMATMPADLYNQPPSPTEGWSLCAHDNEYWACFDWPGPGVKVEKGVGLDKLPEDQDEVDPLFGTTTDQFEARMIPGSESSQIPPSVKAGVTGWNRQPSNFSLFSVAEHQATPRSGEAILNTHAKTRGQSGKSRQPNVEGGIDVTAGETATLYFEILVDMVDASAHLCGLDRDRWRRLVTRESEWRPNVRGGKGKDAAWGLAQIKPSTLRGVSSRLDPRRPWDRLVGAACYLRQMYDRETTGTEEERWTHALHSYRVGPRGERTEGVKAYANWIMGEAQ